MIRTILSQTRTLFGEMKPHQQMTFIVLALCVMVPFGILIFGNQQTGKQPLQWGALFDRDALMQAEQALMEGGFDDFETRGQRIYAPASKVDEYNAVLASTGNVSPGAANAIESLTPFSTNRQFDLAHDADLRARIQRTLRKIRGIQDAEILWSSSKVGRWGSVKMTRASVFVTPSGGRPLEATGAETLRSAVATMLPDLQREDIVVVDRSTNRSWSLNDPNDPFDGDVEARKQRYIEDYQQRIHKELEQIIPNVVVAVNVEFGNVVAGRERSQQVDPKTVELTSISEDRTRTSNQSPRSATPGTQANQPRSLGSGNGSASQTSDEEKKVRTYNAPSLTWTEKEIAGLEAQEVQVAVSIPEEHFEQIVIAEGTSPGATDQEKADFAKKVDDKKNKVTDKVKQFIARLIPSGSAEDAITVTTHRRIEPELPPAELPATELVRDFVNQWGSSVALSVFAIWALVMLRKSMPTSSSVPGTDVLERLTQAVNPPEAEEPEEEPRPVTSRDTLQELVQSDPAAAAAVISRMIQKA
ncbi:MAG: hypothetical protein ACYTGL_00760 [Planctomycetota bacterium]